MAGNLSTREGFQQSPDMVLSTVAFHLEQEQRRPIYTLRTFIEASLIVAKLKEYTDEIKPVWDRGGAFYEAESRLLRDLWQMQMFYEGKVQNCPPDRIEVFSVRLSEYQQLLSDLRLAEEHDVQQEIGQCQETISEFENRYFDVE